jgi:acetolactate synthase I/II/III large subunit
MTEVQDLNSATDSVAAWIAITLHKRGIRRLFGLQGGHIQPIWDHAARLGIDIVDVRDEGAAVHMAHAHAELTGELGVAMATAGPGVTNCVTGIANASLARVPMLLIGGCTSRFQANMGPLQDIPHVDILKPVSRYARTARVADQVIRELDEAIACANGDLGEPGPSYIEVPTDVLRTRVSDHLIPKDWMEPKPRRRCVADQHLIDEAANAIRNSKRPLVISGRGARGAGDQITKFLHAANALYLDTQESRGLVPANHRSVVGAVRAAAMGQADLVITLGRKLDYQLGFGSPAVFPEASFLRIADTAGELVDNRRGSPEILASVDLTLEQITEALGNDAGERDEAWLDDLRAKHRERMAKGEASSFP